jgi:hypothetical protein
MTYIGIDDTDVVGSPGTNQLARAIVETLSAAGEHAIVCRHQLFFDPRVPYTSQNGSASIQLPRGHCLARTELIETVRAVMRRWFVEGSDPGLAVAAASSAGMTAFAARAKCKIVGQAEAQAVAAAAGCHLEGLGGTNHGIIGALAAVALAEGGNDGRVVHRERWPWPDPFNGPQSAGDILARGVDEIRSVSGQPFVEGTIDVGKHLRPNWRDRRVVLLVEPAANGRAWRACKLD